MLHSKSKNVLRQVVALVAAGPHDRFVVDMLHSCASDACVSRFADVMVLFIFIPRERDIEGNLPLFSDSD